MADQNSFIFIPKNVVQQDKILGFRKRNLLEGVLETAAWTWLMFQIPFIISVRWILIIVIGAAILFLNFKGIKGNPISSTVINFFKYRKIIKQYEFRRISKEYRSESVFDEDTREVRTIKTWNPSTRIEAFLEQFKEN